MTETDSKHLERAIRLAEENVTAGGGPFGALIVSADGRVFEAGNRVTSDNDPTAHAEVSAIRLACRELGTFELQGATLYTSCEPCPMCLASALWARVSRVLYAADRHAAARAGFSDAEFYDWLEGRADRELMTVEHVERSDSEAPFDAWRAFSERVEY
ncbi:MAG TPA: nucleoside deaminase [Deinococcales bacterium]|nr:nucleoside deaminase [Deinococcales bacterium]